MIKLIVWSKDRACQLDLLLRSIEKNISGVFDTTVIYTHSKPEFHNGYIELSNRHNCEFVEESNFYNDTRNAIKNSYCRRLAFSTDDTVIYKLSPIDGPQLERLCDGVGVFSLRLGLNTIVQNIHENTKQPPLNIYHDEGHTISWPWTAYHPLHNYGYPFGLDMHIYSRPHLLSLVNDLDFKNSNQLETALFHKRFELSPFMRSFKHSIAVNVPVNNMSKVTRAGEQYPYSLEYLNSEFLDGREIDLDLFSEVAVVGCHQEFPLRLKDV